MILQHFIFLQKLKIKLFKSNSESYYKDYSTDTLAWAFEFSRLYVYLPRNFRCRADSRQSIRRSYYRFDCQFLSPPPPPTSTCVNFSSSSFSREKSAARATRASFTGRDYLRGKILDCPRQDAGQDDLRERFGMAPRLRLRYGAAWRKEEMAVKLSRGIRRRSEKARRRVTVTLSREN